MVLPIGTLGSCFEQQIGVSPKAYIQHQQILFAKSLLHQTLLPINQIAYACGFNNVRRFNDAFKRISQKTPSEVRKRHGTSSAIRLQLNYQPPFDWESWRDFTSFRQIEGIETIGNSSYGRTFSWLAEDGRWINGKFNAVHRPDKQGFNVSIDIDDAKYLYPVSQKIRQLFDLNANIELIEQQLLKAGFPEHNMKQGLRLPGCWSKFEAGVRAILGQQVSVKSATTLITTLVKNLGDRNEEGDIWFPTPAQVAKSDLNFLNMPEARKASIKSLAKYCAKYPEKDISTWLDIKGIGPWTVEYAQMRGEENPDIWLDSDLGIKKALDIFPMIDAEQAKPWRSYLTIQMWGML